MKVVAVAAAIIWNEAKDALLISRRPDHLHKGGYWEFPGGKIEVGESAVEALSRELLEELNIQFESAEFFRQIDFSYPEKSVSLQFFHVYGLCGEVRANEGQEWRWVSLSELINYQFPEANLPIVEVLLASQ